MTPWEFAGLDRITYSKLKWPEMRKILIRFKGIVIQDSCFECGKRESVIREEQERAAMPAELRNHPFGRLLWAHRKHEAETFTIKNNTGGVL